MLTVRSGPVAGVLALAALLGVLAATVGLTSAGWVTGLGCGVLLNAAVAVGVLRCGHVPGPADLVTLARATLSCGVAALTADSFLRDPATGVLVGLATVALALDLADGWVARRTGTASGFGGRFDGEADALLMLVLSGYVAPVAGGWVLAIGVARYAFGLAGWVLPWMRRRLPPRYWRKVVTAVQGIVLTTAAAEVLPVLVVQLALVAALVLLAESFGRDVWWLWRRRDAADRQRDRKVAGGVTTALAALLLWFALLAPNRAGELTAGAFLRVPVEAVALAALALVLPPLGRRTVAVTAGVLLGVLSMLKVLDMAFFTALDRPFNPVTDRGYLGPALDVVKEGFGRFVAALVTVLAIALAVAFIACMPLALARLMRLVAAHRERSARAVAAVGAVWLAFAVLGIHVAGGRPVASASAGLLAVEKVRATVHDVGDLKRFEAAAAADAYRDTDLLSGLRGKDVLVVFVESYGRGVVGGPRSSPYVRTVLESGTARLLSDGYSTRSAFLTSPTFGGLSWLAHSTLQSGLRIDNQLRYSELLSGDRLTLSAAFGQEGWRTVGVMPSDTDPWPEGKRFYGFDRIYDRTNLGYEGPRFGWSAMPDQYALAAFHRLELARSDRAPVMAEIDLTSSHTPWAALPRMLDWDDLGDGTTYESVRDQAVSAEQLWRNADDVRAAYARSIGYSLEAVISFVETYGDDDLVLLVLGDHQPATIVAGEDSTRDVPVTLVSRDADVMERVSSWEWQDGMLPTSRAPVWPMDAFRDRFLGAYSGPLRDVVPATGGPRS